MRTVRCSDSELIVAIQAFVNSQRAAAPPPSCRTTEHPENPYEQEMSTCRICGGYDYHFPVSKRSHYWGVIVGDLVCPVCLFKLSVYNPPDDRDGRWGDSAEIEQGHLLEPFEPIASGKFGCVYIAPSQGYYKVGATVASVLSRMDACGCPRERFLHAIGTHNPFCLERAIHDRLREKQIEAGGQREIFDLSDNDISWIKNIKTLGGKPVKHYRSLRQVPVVLL